MKRKGILLLLSAMVLLTACGSTNEQKEVAKAQNNFAQLDNGYITAVNTTTFHSAAGETVATSYMKIFFRHNAKGAYDHQTTSYHQGQEEQAVVTRIVDGKAVTIRNGEEKESSDNRNGSHHAIISFFTQSPNEHIQAIRQVQEGDLTGYEFVEDSDYLARISAKPKDGGQPYVTIQERSTTYWLNSDQLLVGVDQNVVQTVHQKEQASTYTFQLTNRLMGYNQDKFAQF